MKQDINKLATLQRFEGILKSYSEQFELLLKDEDTLGAITFVEEYPLRMEQITNNLLRSIRFAEEYEKTNPMPIESPSNDEYIKLTEESNSR